LLLVNCNQDVSGWETNKQKLSFRVSNCCESICLFVQEF